jgi:hypothetical protein
MAFLFCIFLIIVVFSLVIEIITEMYNLIGQNTYVYNYSPKVRKFKKIMIVTYYTFIYSCAYFSTLFIIFYILYFIIIK